MEDFREELKNLINRAGMENESDTPDFILADFLMTCLDAFHEAIYARENWFNGDGDEWYE